MIRPGWLRTLLIGSLAALGLSAGFLYRSIVHAERVVVLEPAEVSLVEDPLEPEVVKVHLRLWNRGSSPIRVNQATASCGCMALLTTGHAPLAHPVDVPAGGSLPWEVAIKTEGRIGLQNYWVTMEYERAGAPGQVSSKIVANVRAGWRADPYEITAYDLEPGVAQTREINIYDAHPNPGIKIKEITSSNPAEVQARFSASGPSSGDDEAAIFGRDARLKKRYVIHLDLTPRPGADSLIEETLTLVPEGPKYQPMMIPVIYSLRKPEYELMPRSLTVVAGPMGSPGAHLVRTVSCRIAEGSDPNLRVLSAPGFIDVAIREDGKNSRAIRIDLGPPSGTAFPPGEIVFAAGESSRPVCRLPLVFYKDEGQSSRPTPPGAPR